MCTCAKDTYTSKLLITSRRSEESSIRNTTADTNQRAQQEKQTLHQDPQIPKSVSARIVYIGALEVNKLTAVIAATGQPEPPLQCHSNKPKNAAVCHTLTQGSPTLVARTSQTKQTTSLTNWPRYATAVSGRRSGILQSVADADPDVHTLHTCPTTYTPHINQPLATVPKNCVNPAQRDTPAFSTHTQRVKKLATQFQYPKHSLGVSRLLFLLMLFSVTMSLMPSRCSGIPVSQFFPFGKEAGDTGTDRSDDGGSGKINLTVRFPFFGRLHNQLYVNNNGIISFLTELRTYRPKLFPLEAPTPLIAPFWADVDISDDNVGNVWFRQSRLPADLARATEEVRSYPQAKQTFRAYWVLVATWDRVPFYGRRGASSETRNTFQAILALDTTGTRSFAIFNYANITWTTGVNSGGDEVTGLEGNAANAGFNAGDKVNFYEIEGARTPSVLNLTFTSNIGIPGKYIFLVDSAEIQNSCSVSESGDLFFNPALGSQLGGQLVTLGGPCVSEGATVRPRFTWTGEEMCCRWEDDTTVMCVTPSVLDTGDREVKLSISAENGTTREYTGKFAIANLVDLPQHVVRVDPETWVPGARVTVRLIKAQSDIFQRADMYRFEILEYKENDDGPSLTSVWRRDFPQSADNRYTFELTTNFSTGMNIAVIRVMAYMDICDNQGPSIFSDVFPVRPLSSLEASAQCSDWLAREATLTPLNAEARGRCPCLQRQALRDTVQFRRSPFCSEGSSWPANCLYHDTSVASSPSVDCYVSVQSSFSEDQLSCCYDTSTGELLTPASLGVGTLERFPLRTSFVKPLAPTVSEDTSGSSVVDGSDNGRESSSGSSGDNNYNSVVENDPNGRNDGDNEVGFTASFRNTRVTVEVDFATTTSTVDDSTEVNVDTTPSLYPSTETYNISEIGRTVNTNNSIQWGNISSVDNSSISSNISVNSSNITNSTLSNVGHVYNNNSSGSVSGSDDNFNSSSSNAEPYNMTNNSSNTHNNHWNMNNSSNSYINITNNGNNTHINGWSLDNNSSDSNSSTNNINFNNSSNAHSNNGNSNNSSNSHSNNGNSNNSSNSHSNNGNSNNTFNENNSNENSNNGNRNNNGNNSKADSNNDGDNRNSNGYNNNGKNNNRRRLRRSIPAGDKEKQKRGLNPLQHPNTRFKRDASSNSQQNSVSYFSHMANDIAPRMHCCAWSSNQAQCKQFQQFRQPVSCQDYEAPILATSNGDPHIETLDNKPYTFNGLGEFTLVKVKDSTAEVQVKATQAVDMDGQLQNATVFTGLVVKGEGDNSPRVELVMRNMNTDQDEDVTSVGSTSGRSTRYYILVNGEEREDGTPDAGDDGNEGEVQDGGASNETVVLSWQVGKTTIRENRTMNATPEVMFVLEDISLSVIVEVEEELLNIMVVAGPRLKGNLQGLLGNYNGDPTDDFMSRDGMLLSPDAAMRQVHLFGMSWQVSANESLFYHPTSPEIITTQLAGVAADMELSKQESFTPVFLDEIVGIEDDAGQNVLRGFAAGQSPVDLCQGNMQCMFDLKVTKNDRIALSTLKFSELVQERKQEMLPVVRCPYVDDITHGNRSLSGQKIGDTARFTCNPGYRMVVEEEKEQRTLTCLDSGEWDGAPPVCVKVINTEEELPVIYIAIGAAAGAFLLVFVLSVVIRLVHRRLNQQWGKKSDTSSRSSTDFEQAIELPTLFPISHIPGPVFENPLFMQRCS